MKFIPVCVLSDSLDAGDVVGNALLELGKPTFDVVVATLEALTRVTRFCAPPTPNPSGPRRYICP